MSLELQTLITELLPPTRGIRLTEVTVQDESVQLQLTAIAPTALCPDCAVPSSSIHSRYQRRLADLPWGSLAIRMQLIVRKFVCCHLTCARRIFAERLPDFAAPYARKTMRLVNALQAIGIALGGQAGTRLAARLRLPTSPSTLLRLVRATSVPHTPALQAIGIDEWAWQRGHRYGTILVDLATHRVIDLLPDRSAATVAAWLAQHPTITAVCRDRSELYAEGIRRGAPEAAQVLTLYIPYLIRRWHERGTRTDSVQLWRGIQALGYTHSARTVCRFITRLRRAAEVGQAPEAQASPYIRPQGPSARAVSFAMICPAAKRSEHAQMYLDQLCHMNPSIARAYALSQAFLAMVRERGGGRRTWPRSPPGSPSAWSHGVTEGQMHRLTLGKRQSSGRAGFALLRPRVLQAASRARADSP